MDWDKPFFLSQVAIKALRQSTRLLANGTGRYTLPTPQANGQSTAHLQMETLALMGLLLGKAE